MQILGAMSLAILFSKPSPPSLEKGRSCGSAQARKTCGSISSIEPSASWAPATPGRVTPTSASSVTAIDLAALAIAALTHAFCFRLFEFRRLVVVLGRPSTRNRVLRAGAQIHIDVVQIAHHILVLGEGGHDFFLARAEVLLAASNDPEEFGIPDRFQ